MAATCVDRGGTFTDVVTFDESGVHVRKVPSDRAVVGQLAVGDLRFGTTVATNAALERTGLPVTLFVTEGFEDLHRIGDMTRRALFDADATWPPLPVARVVPVSGRIHADGTCIEPLVLPDLPNPAPRSIAVALINSGRNPAHEHALAAHLRARWPDVPITLGSELSASVGYLARIETAVVDAAITPLLATAMHDDAIAHDAMAIRSDASLCAAPSLRAPDALLSGPAGGVLAVAHVARQAGFQRAVGLDMGGTSTDVCRVDTDLDGALVDELRLAGLRVRRPSVEVHTIAAGGGSIADIRHGQLTVGPQSAGADPGPQCYGRGGPPTVTDAAAAMGWIDPNAFDPPLDLSAIDLPAAPEAIIEVAVEAMAHAVETLAVQRGVSLHDHALVSYGGAAGQFAAAVAERTGMRTVLVHPLASVLSAYGQRFAQAGEEVREPVWCAVHEAVERLGPVFERMEAHLGHAATRWATVRRRGTDHSVRLPAHNPADLATLWADHPSTHSPPVDLEVVDAIVTTRQAVPIDDVPLPTDPFGIGDARISGPTVLYTATTAVRVPRGWDAVTVNGLLVLERTDEQPIPMTVSRTAPSAALWGARFQAVAEQGGGRLQRLARSVNIRERLDFSCAVFDPEGRLVANAPHIPVHLGAMGAVVRDLMATVAPIPPGSIWLSNDPVAGGSHLPDLTVVMPVDHDGTRFWVACRGHHVDVGGTTPGSMPPRSTSLSEEGLVFRHVRIDGHIATLPLPGCRAPDTVRDDLRAQCASVRFMSERLCALGPPDTLVRAMAWLADLSEQATEVAIQSLPSGTATDHIDGVPLTVRVNFANGRLRVDWTGTGGPHAGNLNAPHAIVRAATLYVLRCILGSDLPLNEGVLRRVDLVVPSPSIVHPASACAVAGGNVETSQRLVDLLLRATGQRAASQGTMNNLTFGGADWAHYETLGGGTGASARGPGASASQVHMTNTRATDPEVLEARAPLRVRQIAVRHASGGAGIHRGGDGLVRTIEVLERCEVSLLATRRHSGAAGMSGGDAGLPGEDTLVRDGQASRWDGRTTALQPGDRVIVRTPGGGGWGAP